LESALWLVVQYLRTIYNQNKNYVYIEVAMKRIKENNFFFAQSQQASSSSKKYKMFTIYVDIDEQMN